MVWIQFTFFPVSVQLKQPASSLNDILFCNIYQYFQSQPTHTLWQLVLTLISGHRQAMIQDYECIQKLNIVSLRSPPYKLKVFQECGRVKINYKKAFMLSWRVTWSMFYDLCSVIFYWVHFVGLIYRAFHDVLYD